MAQQNRALGDVGAFALFAASRANTATVLRRLRRTCTRSASAAILLFMTVGDCIADSVSGNLPQGDCTSPVAATDLRHCDFSGADLAGRDLSGARLDAVHFDNANLSGSNLSGALLNGAHLTGAVFNRSQLHDARFVNAVVSGADFSGALDAPDHLSEMLAGKGR